MPDKLKRVSQTTYTVVERDTGTKKAGPFGKAKAKQVLAARNLAHARKRGSRVPRTRRR